MIRRFYVDLFLLFALMPGCVLWAQTARAPHAIVLHAKRLLDIENGRVLSPGEVLVEGERIAEVGITVKHSAGVEVIDLSHAFDTVTSSDGLIVAKWDHHTTALGHRLLADKLYERLFPFLQHASTSK